MEALWQWSYQRRDPISIGSALLMAAVAIRLATGLHVTPSPSSVTDMAAVLETPAPPTPPPPPAAQAVPTAPAASPQPTPTMAPADPSDRSTDAAPPSPALPSPALPSPAPTSPPVSAAPAATAEAPVVKPSPPPASPAAGNQYESQLLAAIERNKRYPTSREARLTHPEGTVKVWLELARDGRLLGAGILGSSGSNLLDGEALRSLRNTSFAPMPSDAFAGEASHRFSASLKYQVEAS